MKLLKIMNVYVSGTEEVNVDKCDWNKSVAEPFKSF